jgi:hypothetical protein
MRAGSKTIGVTSIHGSAGPARSIFPDNDAAPRLFNDLMG